MKKLSLHFSLSDFTRDQVNERMKSKASQLIYPTDEHIKNMSALCTRVLDNAQKMMNCPLKIVRGYSTPELSKQIGSNRSSDHTKGIAADVAISDKYLSDPGSKQLIRSNKELIKKITGHDVVVGANMNYWLFSSILLRKDRLCATEIIAEFGDSPARPAWIHLSYDGSLAPGKIFHTGFWTNYKKQEIDVNTALLLGTRGSEFYNSENPIQPSS